MPYSENTFAKKPGKVRQPAVVNRFYTGNPHDLSSEIKSYLAAGKSLQSPPVLLISPHAGYVFSGPVAGMAYATIPSTITRVFIIGPSHYARFAGISIANVDSFATPLGVVDLDKEVIAALRKNTFVHCIPEADEPEHSVEVQLPFLQVVLPTFTIVPIITGVVDPALIADLLIPYINPQTLIIASTDLSHYLSLEEAKKADSATIETILSKNETGSWDACGETAVRIILNCANKLSLVPVLLDSRTSYDVAPHYGDKNRVVGYASFAFVNKS
jgi:AmmeMemoRadiSam system protein B